MSHLCESRSIDGIPWPLKEARTGTATWMIQDLPCGARDVPGTATEHAHLRSSAQPICNPVSDSGALARFGLDLERRDMAMAASSIPSSATARRRKCHGGGSQTRRRPSSCLDPGSTSRLLMGIARRRPSCCRSRPTSQFATAQREGFGAAIPYPGPKHLSWQPSLCMPESGASLVDCALCKSIRPFAGASSNDLGYR